MSMRMEMQMTHSFRAEQQAREHEASVARRARVLAFQLARGELVSPAPYDPALTEVLRLMEERSVPWRVEPGNAAGAVPEVL